VDNNTLPWKNLVDVPVLESAREKRKQNLSSNGEHPDEAFREDLVDLVPYS